MKGSKNKRRQCDKDLSTKVDEYLKGNSNKC